ncbi:MAG: diguanylate cyclase [Thiobacillus sp.]|nr:diguanylate cyclase [Thiobacillus sp.]
MKMFTWIFAWILMGVATCQAAPGESASPVEKVRLQLKWLHQFQFAGYYAALSQGYYREVGLDVAILEAPAHESAVDVVSRGDAEYGVHGSDLVVERARGKPVRALAAIFQHSPMILLARRDRRIDSLHDLANRRLLLGPDAAELAAYLKSEGVPYQLSRTHQSFDLKALLEGDVDAMPAYSTDEVYLMEQAQVPYSQFSPRAAGIDFYGDVLFTSEQELQQHPDRVRRFVEATLRGWYYALAHREELARLIHADYSQRHSMEHLLFEAEQTRRLMTPELVEIGQMNPGRWRHIADTFAELGMMPANYPLDDFLQPREVPPQDYTRFYLTLGAAFLAVALAVWVSLYFSRLNRTLRREVAERQRLQEDLERLANTDALTGLPNRRYFMAQMVSELARRQRYGHPLSLLMLDLDHFKQINDQWGHGVGDEALRQFADSVQCCLRTQDVAGRLGGEEFAILLPETAEYVARPVAERIRARLEQTPVPTGNGPCVVTVSIGVAEVRKEDSVETLMHRADAALYAAKQQGRNRVVSSADL